MAATAPTLAAIDLETLHATDVAPDVEARLLELTLPTGEMAKVYRACRRGGATWTGRVIVARIDDEIVGWALRWKLDGHWRRWNLHMYVHPDHRRRGVATALVTAARHRLRRDTRLRGYVWDDTSAAFWSTIGLDTIDAPDHRH